MEGIGNGLEMEGKEVWTGVGWGLEIDGDVVIDSEFG